MQILIVTETYLPTVSGVASSTHSIAKYMASRGHTVTVVAPAPAISGQVEQVAGLSVRTTPSVHDPVFAGKSMTLFPFGFPVIWNQMHAHRPDIVHIQEPGSLGMTALLVAKHMHIPTVGALHTMPEQFATFFGPLYPFGLWIAKMIARSVYNHYDAVMTPTQTMVTYLRSVGIRAPTHAISNGIDLATYTNAPPDAAITRQFALPRGKVLFGYLGRIDKDKHLDITVRAMTRAKNNVHLVIAGFGKDQPALVALARELGVAGRVTFIGKLVKEQIIQLYRSLDCFVITSPVESQSIVTLEAMACGLPVIAVAAGALPELVHEGQNGFLVPPDDVAAVAQKFNLLAADGALRKKFGAQSRVISQAHDKPKVLHQLEEIYVGLVKQT